MLLLLLPSFQRLLQPRTLLPLQVLHHRLQLHGSAGSGWRVPRGARGNAPRGQHPGGVGGCARQAAALQRGWGPRLSSAGVGSSPVRGLPEG